MIIAEIAMRNANINTIIEGLCSLSITFFTTVMPVKDPANAIRITTTPYCGCTKPEVKNCKIAVLAVKRS